MPELKTLQQHELEKRLQYRRNYEQAPVLNGIACPTCGEELFDSLPGELLMTAPPKKRIHCIVCGFTGYRTA